MIFNFGLPFLIVSFIIPIYINASEANNDSNINTAFEHATDNVPFQCETSSGTSLSSKRKESKISGEIEGKKMRFEYYRDTLPIELNLDPKTEENLAAWERQLFAGGREFVWKDYNNIEEKELMPLCLEVLKLQLPQIKGLKVENDMIADCSPILLPGPSKAFNNTNKYAGNFQYANELRNMDYTVDLVRCNCAYLKIMKTRKARRTAHNTKRYFYVHKHTDIIHIIFIPDGPASSRRVKIVNVCAINEHR